MKDQSQLDAVTINVVNNQSQPETVTIDPHKYYPSN